MFADEQLFQSVQRANQRQVLDKLLHDLRNPIHSLRITIELFARLADRKGDVDALLDRAGRYVAPARAAMEALIANTERLSLYAAAPGAPVVGPVRVDEMLMELAVLLRGAARELKVELAPATQGAALLSADRPRLGHALLRHCLSNAGTQISLSARADAERIWIDVECDPAAHSAAQAADRFPFSVDDFRVLIENAGGALSSDGARLSIGFRGFRPPEPA